ncbi:aminopeptidase N, partial [Nostoc linckia z16]
MATGYAQNSNTIVATLDDAAKVIAVKQEITFTNSGGLPLDTIVLNDWVNAYSGRNTPLAKRFSDEYNWTFHRAREEERGSTTLNSATAAGTPLQWRRPEAHPDLLSLKLTTPLMPGRSITINLDYQVKLPSSRFTRFGYNDKGGYYLKDWYLTPARIENGMFVNYSNENLDDIANAVTDYSVTLTIPSTIALVTDLDVEQKQQGGNTLNYKLAGQG